MVYGAVAVIVGWLVGLFMATTIRARAATSPATASAGATFNYFSWGNAGIFAILALVAGIVAVVVLYLKIAPNMKITWPMPVAQILLGVSVATLVLGRARVLSRSPTACPMPPILMYVADVVLVGGGALMAWGAYQEWLTTKAA